MSSRREDGHVGQENQPRHLDIQVELSFFTKVTQIGYNPSHRVPGGGRDEGNSFSRS